MIAEGRRRRIARTVLAVAYGLAGVAHLTRPGGFVAITPGWVPEPALVIALTGVAAGDHLVGALGERGDGLAVWGGKRTVSLSLSLEGEGCADLAACCLVVAG